MLRRYERACAAALTYPEVGASVEAPTPPGYEELYGRIPIGTAAAFDTARCGLFAWALQRAAGVTVYPPGATAAVGATVLLRLRLGPIAITAPCRVTWAVDGPDRAGFAYGTLPGHPERGEEAFVLDRSGDETRLTVSETGGCHCDAGHPRGPGEPRRCTSR